MTSCRKIVVHFCFVVAIIALALGTSGCFTTPHHTGSDLSKLDTFKIEKGVTTGQELETEFGPPASTVAQSDGTKVLTWMGGESSEKQNLAAVIIPFTGDTSSTGISTKSRSLSATIRDGVVVDYTITNGSQQF